MAKVNRKKQFKDAAKKLSKGPAIKSSKSKQRKQKIKKQKQIHKESVSLENKLKSRIANTAKKSNRNPEIKNKIPSGGKFVAIKDLSDISDEHLHVNTQNSKTVSDQNSQPPNKKLSLDIMDKKTKMDKIQEKDGQLYEMKQSFKEKVTDLKTKGLADMSAWSNLFVPDVVLESLAETGFTSPTPIQALSLPSAIRDKMDIVGAAETGSGKTLAFGIPIVHNVLEYKKTLSQKKRESDSDDDDGNDDEMEVMDGEESASDENPESEESDEQDSDEDHESDENEKLKFADGEEVSGAKIEELDICGVEFNTFDGDHELNSEDEDYDLPPEQEELTELADDELGCVQVINDIEFEWMEKPKKLKAQAASQAPLLSLVLCPTRELAMQVAQHLKQIVKHTSIKVATVVGGMSVQKQERLLKRCPEIVVATPGRLWELIQEGQPHVAKVEYVKNLVIDEADRMVEKGHFQELTQLLDMINSNEAEKKKRQTFVFSATLTLAHGGPDRVILNKKKKQKFKKMSEKEKLDSLMVQIGLKSKPKILDLTRKQGTAETLVESRIVCDKNEKDLYLYYFKQQYAGRTLVFTNSKDCIRRLTSIFTILECNPLPLHSDMHQTQRLKNLDRFKDNKNGFLLATDVAARGLDIPDVQHVIHYQVPRTTENYVHRSGRTARASKEGLSVMLVSPEDLKNYRNIIKTLNRDEELPTFPVESEVLSSLKPCLSLAMEIDKFEHKQVKQKKENSWFMKAAKEMDMELDEDKLLYDMGDSYQQAESRRKLKFMKMELKHMLKTPMSSRQFSGKYPTKSGKLIIPHMSVDENINAVTRIKADIKKTNSVVAEHEQNKSKKFKDLSKKKQKFLKKRKYFQNKNS